MVLASVPEIEKKQGKVDERIEDEDEVNVSDTRVLSFFGARAL